VRMSTGQKGKILTVDTNPAVFTRSHEQPRHTATVLAVSNRRSLRATP
jgi:hypothetical protein